MKPGVGGDEASVQIKITNHARLKSAPWGYCLVEITVARMISLVVERNPHTNDKEEFKATRGWVFREGFTPTVSLLDVLDALDYALSNMQ